MFFKNKTKTPRNFSLALPDPSKKRKHLSRDQTAGTWI
jgi:hypothetical protein